MHATARPHEDRPEQVYQELRKQIIRGRIAPGARVVEIDIAARLRVSRTPVRAAVARLAQEGFLTSTGPSRRTELLVAPMTAADVLDVYQMMGALEGSAARRVGALDAPVRRALATELRRREAAFEAAARQRTIDYARLFELHNAVHQCLMDACAPPRLRSLVELLRPQVDRYEWVYAPLVGPNYDDTFREHADIIRAVRDGAGDRARRAMVANWENGGERLARVVEQTGARGDW
jgi:DNA-binding GntR family transcriptional regulator